MTRQAEINAMEIGQSISVACRIPVPHTGDGCTSAQLRSTFDKPCQRATAKLGHRYKIETGSFVTQENAIIAVAVATRIS